MGSVCDQTVISHLRRENEELKAKLADAEALCAEYGETFELIASRNEWHSPKEWNDLEKLLAKTEAARLESHLAVEAMRNDVKLKQRTGKFCHWCKTEIWTGEPVCDDDVTGHSGHMLCKCVSERDELKAKLAEAANDKEARKLLATDLVALAEGKEVKTVLAENVRLKMAKKDAALEFAAERWTFKRSSTNEHQPTHTWHDWADWQPLLKAAREAK